MCYLNKVNTIIWRTHLWPLLLDNIEIHLRWREVIRHNILLGTRLSVPKSFNYREGKPNWGDTFIMKNNTCKLAKVGVDGLIRSPLRICSCRFSWGQQTEQIQRPSPSPCTWVVSFKGDTFLHLPYIWLLGLLLLLFF